MDTLGQRIHITGVVQGVGFRPFIYGLAHRLQLNGWVQNTIAGVDIEIYGSPSTLAAFLTAIRAEAPPLAEIEQVSVTAIPVNGHHGFQIITSAGNHDPLALQPISADVCVCDDCLREMNDPNDRRYRYPFINCTNCGPRYTIIQDLPYDRTATSMAQFEMCPACEKEYRSPTDRRFHAQPIACPTCGPDIWLEVGNKMLGEREKALQAARQIIARGQILALKGLGGFQLVCDATNPEAIATLRQRKHRPSKPLALMLPNLAAVAEHCELTPADETLLSSAARPIVLLPLRRESTIARECAPDQTHIGVMLPYTPLHVLLCEPAPHFPSALVMTSGNLSAAPIETENDNARQKLVGLAGAFLFHNRPIHTRADDSVTSTVAGAPYPIRRARGYAPSPIKLPWELPAIFAAGAELKNTFCHTRQHYAFLSPHIGDLENYETLAAYEHAITHHEHLFRIQPTLLAADLHPNYLSTRYAMARAEKDGLPLIQVQHHHAHIAAAMAENSLPNEPVIGLSFDGTGYGSDGTIWGGEVLVADYSGFRRALHLQPCRLPGGDLAVRQPWRMALAWLRQTNLAWQDNLAPVRAAEPARLIVLEKQLESGLNAPFTSSMGRLFDAVAALIGLAQTTSFEGQAAMHLEAIVAPGPAKPYPFEIKNDQWVVNRLFQAIVADLSRGQPAAIIAARFHASVATMALAACQQVRTATGINQVVLSGGVWQNRTLLNYSMPLLRDNQFEVYIHRQVPTNDGGLALGQAIVAWHQQP